MRTSTLQQDLKNPALRTLVGTATRSAGNVRTLAAVQAQPKPTPSLYNTLEDALRAELPDEFDRHDAVLELLHQCALTGAHWPDSVATQPVYVYPEPSGWHVLVGDRSLHLFRMPGADTPWPGGFQVWDATPVAGPTRRVASGMHLTPSHPDSGGQWVLATQAPPAQLAAQRLAGVC